MSRWRSVFGLRAVAAFEAVKGAIVLIAGFGLARLIDTDLQQAAENLVDRLHLTLKLGGEARFWHTGRPSQAALLHGYFMHPQARWARVFATLEAATQYSHEQHLSARRLTVEELFAPETLDAFDEHD